MSFEPSVSVVIPYYNHRRYVGEALQSAVRQTFLPLEIIVADDASEHEPFPLEKWKKALPVPLKYIRLSRHRGAAAARNAAIRKARGRYIAFLDADDCWDTRHLEDFREAFRHYRHVHYYSARSVFFQRRCPEFSRVRSGGFEKASYLNLAMRKAAYINASSVILSAALIRETGYFDERLPVFEDIDYWLRSGRKAPVVFNPRPRVAVRRNEGGGLSTQLDLYTDPHVVEFLNTLVDGAQPLPLRKFGHLNIFGTLMRFWRKGRPLPAPLVQRLNPRMLPFPKSIAAAWMKRFGQKM